MDIFLRAFCKVHIIKKSIDTISSNEISIQYIIDTIAVIADLNKAIQLDPTLDEAYEERFSFYQYRHPSLALKDINTLIANHPDSSSYFLTRKTLHYENNNFLLAFSDLEKCYELGYSRHTYLFEKGDIYIQLKQYDKAVIIYTTLLESSDKMKKESKGFILFKRGLAYFHLQKFQLSLNDFNNALSIGNYNWGMYYKGICLHELGHKKEACEVWNERLGTIFLDYSLYNKLQKLIEKKCN